MLYEKKYNNIILYLILILIIIIEKYNKEENETFIVTNYTWANFNMANYGKIIIY